MYDCEGTEKDWAPVKQQYCCARVGVGCIGDIGEHLGWKALPEYAKPSPQWLNWWMGDLSVASKFVITMLTATLLGCCCGWCCLRGAFKKVLPPVRCPTNAELSKEVEKACHRYGAKSGEISVTMMWDTTDDLDLVLELPDGKGTICAANPECCGGKLDVDGNVCLQRARPTCHPIEHIYFPYFSPGYGDQDMDVEHVKNFHMQRQGVTRMPPPIGEYNVRCRVSCRHGHLHDVYVTLEVTILDKKEVHFHRIVPGSTEAHLNSFYYEPVGHGRDRDEPRRDSRDRGRSGERYPQGGRQDPVY